VWITYSIKIMHAVRTRKWRALGKTALWCSVEQESVLQPLAFQGLPSSRRMITVFLWFYLLVKCYCLVIFITRAGGEISRILLFEILKSVAISDAVSIYVRQRDLVFMVTWFMTYGYVNLLSEPSSNFIFLYAIPFFFGNPNFIVIILSSWFRAS